jgi:hypothetical protein
MTHTAIALIALLSVAVAGAVAHTSTPQAPAAREAVALTWAKPDHFWYHKTINGAHVWLTVDAAHGVREPLFDHQRLAIELNLRSGHEFTPTTLPFADPAARFVVKYDGSNAYIQEGAMAIEFVLDGQHWRCELQVKWDWNKVPPTDYECLPRRPAAAMTGAATTSPAAVRSPDGRWEALVQNDNVGIRPAGSQSSATSLSSDGASTFAYQSGSIRWSADSQSVSAWRVDQRVWQSNSVTGTVKGLVAKGQWAVR